MLHNASWFFDPTTCPSCRSPLPAPQPGLSCPRCGVALTGPTGLRLANQLRDADRTLAQLRRERTPAAPAPTPGPNAPRFAAPTFSNHPSPSGFSAPVARPKRFRSIGPAGILLGLGGLCLVVAAIVFLSMSWTALTLGEKVAVLGGVTLLLSGLAGWTIRKGLRGSAETLMAITFADLTLDVFAARRADLLGLRELPLHLFTSLGAGLVAVVALGCLLAVKQFRLVSPQVTTALAGSLAISSVLTAHSVPQTFGLALSVVGIGGLGLGLRRVDARIGALVAAGLTTLPWLQLLANGIVQVLQGDYAHRLLRGHAWDLPFAAALAVVGAGVPSLLRAGWLRIGVAATGLLVFEVSFVSTAYSYLPFAAALALGIMVPVAGGFLTSPVWRAASSMVLAVLAAIALPLLSIAAATGIAAGIHQGPGLWRSAADLRLSGWTLTDTWAMLGLLAAIGLAGVRQLPDHKAWTGPAVLVSAVAISLDWHPVAWIAVAAWLLAAAVAGVLAQRPAQLCFAAGAFALGLLTALPSDINSGWAYAVGAFLIAVLARRLSEQYHRTAAELGALTQLLIAVTASTHAISPANGTPAVVGLLVVGAVAAVAALLSPSRRWWLWLSFAATTGAIWIEGAVHQVQAVELYCVPLAVLVLTIGYREARARELSSWLSYGTGLLILTVPSTVLALDDPLGWRAWAVGAAALALVLAGSRLKLQSPLLIGAFELGLLVLREVGPYALALPRWAGIAAVGLILLGTGITWENRLANLHQARRRLAELH